MKPQNWNIFKTAYKNVLYYQIASRAFMHAKTLKFFRLRRADIALATLVLSEISFEDLRNSNFCTAMGYAMCRKPAPKNEECWGILKANTWWKNLFER